MTSIDEEAELRTALGEKDEQYDPELDMVETPFSTPGYHTTLEDPGTVHPTRDSLSYAVSLLDRQDPDTDERAFDIIRTVISLQDRDEERDTYGIWPWFYEEPLEEMDPPDWNWADFCGKRLLMAAGRHDRIPDDLADEIESSLRAACDAIIERDVRVGYTNIAIMGAFVTLRAGELYDWDSCREYGIDRLRRFADHTGRFDAFEEYNSPTYTVVAIEELAAVETHSETPEAAELSSELLDLAWGTVAEHFHPATEQWSGPHSRAYDTLLGDDVRTFVQLATDGTVTLVPEDRVEYDPEWYWVDLSCPEQYWSEFQEPAEDWIFRTIREDDNGVDRHAATYLTEEYSLGTFDKEVMWNQRRNLLAYLSNGGEPAYVHLRFLKDGYDFSSAVFTAAHDRDTVLFGVNVATDGGDTHVSLDPTDGEIDCQDLRLRFEVGGNLAGTEADVARRDGTERVRIAFPDHEIAVDSLATELDWEPGGWIVDRTDEQLHVDYALYDGDERTFDLSEIERAALVFAFGISGAPLDSATAKLVNETVVGELDAADRKLRVSIGATPASEAELFERNEADIE